MSVILKSVCAPDYSTITRMKFVDVEDVMQFIHIRSNTTDMVVNIFVIM